MKQISDAEDMLNEALEAEALGENKMQKYVSKSAVCCAIQYTGDNREKIIEALHIKKEHCQSWMNEDTKESYLIICAPGCNLGKVSPKEWILVGIDPQSYQIVIAETFDANYEAI